MENPPVLMLVWISSTVWPVVLSTNRATEKAAAKLEVEQSNITLHFILENSFIKNSNRSQIELHFLAPVLCFAEFP